MAMLVSECEVYFVFAWYERAYGTCALGFVFGEFILYSGLIRSISQVAGC